MTLRLRLVLAIVAMVTAGLAMFGVATYTLYSRSEYQRLDIQLRASASLVDSQLDAQANLAVPQDGHGGPAGGGRGRPGPAPTAVAPGGTYGELRDRTGAILSRVQSPTGAAQPRLSSSLPVPTSAGRLFSVGSTSGSSGFRVLETTAGAIPGGTLIVAVPISVATNRLHELILIEAGGATILLLFLSTGSWLVLRRGLRPLERMAGTARAISTGDLSQRVTTAGGASEVGQLGLALNTMLDDIETAFQERDATELRLRQFLADASHELRTPLTSIQGFAELFRISGDNARVDLPTILRRIEEESARMKILVEDLLLLARLDQTRAPERGPVDLAVVAADACSDAAATAPDRAISLDAPEPVVLAGDEAYLRQAAANLMTNAMRHTPAGTAIDVTARLVDGAAALSIRDHGPGLSDADMAHVFDRFWQADESRVGTGAGLGLAIVSSIAAEHGGTATAANAATGGAIFTIRLPIAGLPIAGKAPAAKSGTGPR